MPDRLHALELPLAQARGGPESDTSAALLTRAAAARLRVDPSEIAWVEVIKRSLDARRRRPEPAWIFTVDVWRASEAAALAAHREDLARRLDPRAPIFLRGPRRPPRGARPIIVGTGPAGLFAALTFADHGIPCTVVERGDSLEQRHRRVRAFRRRGELDPESNLCFGEGGAGTYSDGKLYTRKHHPLVRTVYERLVAYGATGEILTEAHPHIGTNRLYAILAAIREHLQAQGSEIRFGARVTDLAIEGGHARGVVLATGEELAGAPVLLATGHSARDVYELLHRRGVPLEMKSFAVGARCEHPQALIDRIQLGRAREHEGVGAAEYFLSCQVGDRGVYSFCMCPGGYIIPTPTEPEHLNVNGMSNSNRGGDFANAALVVTVNPADYFVERPGDLDHHGVLAGIAFQRAWESRAYQAGGGGYIAPAQRLTDLASGRPSRDLPARTSYRPGLVAAELAGLLPEVTVASLARAVRELDHKMRGFFTEEAILVGVETTTSSPVRISRGEDRQSPGVAGLYPTGEGAGFSGGIVSSAIEGVESAWAAIDRWFPAHAPG
jgi:uncharacterized FAD-dependent dehydrogenase